MGRHPTLPQVVPVTIIWKENDILGRHFSLKQPELWFLSPTNEALESYFSKLEVPLSPPAWKRITTNLGMRSSVLRKMILLEFIFGRLGGLKQLNLGAKVESLVPTTLRINPQTFPESEYDEEEEGASNIKSSRNQSQDDLIFCSLLLQLSKELFRDLEWYPTDWEKRALLLILEGIGLDEHSLYRTYKQLTKDFPKALEVFNRSVFSPPTRKRVRKPKRRRSSEDRHGKDKISHSGVPYETRKMYKYEIIYFQDETSVYPKYREQVFSTFSPKVDNKVNVEVVPFYRNSYYKRFAIEWRERIASNVSSRQPEEEN